MSRQSHRLARRAGAAVIASLLALVVPALALAHPLGNFTINHFAAIRVAPHRISLDVIIDRAEIPAFQELQRLDVDGDGMLLGPERAAAALAGCSDLRTNLVLTLDGRALDPALTAAGLSLPPGAAGLPTMRLVCEYDAAISLPIVATAAVAFEDRSHAERIGWREIVVLGDGLRIAGDAIPGDGEGVSKRLTAYPVDLLAQPLEMRTVAVAVGPGGPALAPWSAPDATPLSVPDLAAGVPGTAASTAAVPGGVAEDLAALVDIDALTPLAILASLAVAFGLGVVHALSPGHGKTIMAAYLVGTNGSSRQAVGLGLAVTVSHTLGVLALAGITLAASSLVPPERLYPILGIISGTLVIGIGAALLWSRLRVIGLLAWRAGNGNGHDHDHGQGHVHDHHHGQGHGSRGHGPSRPHAHPHRTAGAAEHGHPHPHSTPAGGDVVSWKGLVALGLSGGLVPSASALILLLGSIAAGRVAYGVILVLGFGVGMAVVLTGIGLLVVNARRLIDRRPPTVRLQRMVMPVQLATASVVVVLGIVLTGQALTQVL